jgi:hypothetical protein
MVKKSFTEKLSIFLGPLTLGTRATGVGRGRWGARPPSRAPVSGRLLAYVAALRTAWSMLAKRRFFPPILGTQSIRAREYGC